MPTTVIPAQKHVRSAAPYNANTFAEQNGALVGRSARLRGFGFVSLVGPVLTLSPGAFLSYGLALNATQPNRLAGLVAETTSNIAIDVTGLTGGDFYVYALANSPSESTTVDFVAAASASPGGQYASIIRRVAGQYVLEDGLGADSLFAETVDVRVDSGASQFFLTPTAPGVVTITGASLPNGNTYAGNVGFTGNPLFTNGSPNYIWFNTTTLLIENSTVAFPAGTDYLRLWILTLDGSGNVTSLQDRRPWFSPMAGAGGGGGVFEGPGTFLQADLTTLGNQYPAPAWIFSQGQSLTWNATTSTLSWAGAGTMNFQAADELTYFINTVAPGSLSPIADGDYVYADLNRAGGAIVLAISPGGAPAPALNRVLVGRRTASQFLMTSGHTLNNSAAIPGAGGADFAPQGLPSDRWEALQGNPSAPTAANYFLTLADKNAMVLDDLADVSANEAAAFNAAGVAGATGANRLAVLSDITAIAGLRGAGAALFAAGPATVFTHSFSGSASFVYIDIVLSSGANSGTKLQYVLRRSTNQIYGMQAVNGAPTVNNGTVITLGVTVIGGFFIVTAHTGTTITLSRFAGVTVPAMVIGFG